MSKFYFERLKQLKECKRLKIYLVIAPPRANSTVIEHALGNSPDIEHECHEPFLGARHDGFDFEHGYKQIYDSIGGDPFYESGRSTSVVVKEMSHWIGRNGEYKRLFELTTEPVLILIRNPLLTVESRLRQVVKGLDMRYSLDLQRYLLDHTAVKRGFPSWELMLRDAFSEKPTVSLDFLKIRAGKERLYDTPILTLQNLMLDQLSQSEGYTNWRDLIQKKLYSEFDYTFFSEILLSNKRRSIFEEIEFKKLDEEVDYLKVAEIDFFIIDTTDMRIQPEIFMSLVCQKLNLSFTMDVVKWGDKEIDFHTEQKQEFEKLWYDTLFSSSRINPPTEIPPKLSMFPEHMQNYLKEFNLPIYRKLAIIKLGHKRENLELKSESFYVSKNEYNKSGTRQNGFTPNIDTNENDLILLKIEQIDPVYAVTNNESLISLESFKFYKEKYEAEIAALQN